MSKDNKKTTGSEKKEFFLKRWIKRIFCPQKEVVDIYTEEKMETPARVVAKNFFSKPLPVICLVIFILIVLFVFIAPHFVDLDLGEQDSTLVFIEPGYSMMKYPAELKENGVRDISVGVNYSIGVDKNGKVYVWGKSNITSKIDLKEIPEEVLNANIVKVAAGEDHALAVDDQGRVYGWGNSRLKQLMFPREIEENNKNPKFHIEKIYASTQFSVAVTDEHNIYAWGNDSFVDLKIKKEFQGHVVDAALTTADFLVLTDDGRVCTPHKHPSGAVARVPEELQEPGSVKALVSAASTVAAIDKNGDVKLWGAPVENENKMPEISSKVAQIVGGRYHYSAILENGEVISWGGNRYKQCKVPNFAAKPENVDRKLYAGSFQTYLVDNVLNDEGEVIGAKDITGWGLKGFLMGTDALGRDVFARLVNGGKATMTIGIVAVIISNIIGIILGGIAGYFGGHTDMIISRIAEVIGSLPFLPFCMILSAVLGTMISVQARMYLVMVILGVLSWTGMYYLVRAQMFAQREMEYVVAAKTLGLKESKIIFKHIVPNVMSVCLVSITLQFGGAMLQEASLSYLGFGVPPPTPTWGNMLNGANKSVVIQQYWWNWVFVGAIFGLTCICINLIGDGLRDALDPKVNGR